MPARNFPCCCAASAWPPPARARPRPAPPPPAPRHRPAVRVRARTVTPGRVTVTSTFSGRDQHLGAAVGDDVLVQQLVGEPGQRFGERRFGEQLIAPSAGPLGALGEHDVPVAHFVAHRRRRHADGDDVEGRAAGLELLQHLLVLQVAELHAFRRDGHDHRTRRLPFLKALARLPGCLRAGTRRRRARANSRPMPFFNAPASVVYCTSEVGRSPIVTSPISARPCSLSTNAVSPSASAGSRGWPPGCRRSRTMIFIGAVAGPALSTSRAAPSSRTAKSAAAPGPASASSTHAHVDVARRGRGGRLRRLERCHPGRQARTEHGCIMMSLLYQAGKAGRARRSMGRRGQRQWPEPAHEPVHRLSWGASLSSIGSARAERQETPARPKLLVQRDLQFLDTPRTACYISHDSAPCSGPTSPFFSSS